VPIPSVMPQLVPNDGVHALRAAIDDPDAYGFEPKVDGVRLLLTFPPTGRRSIPSCSITRCSGPSRQPRMPSPRTYRYCANGARSWNFRSQLGFERSSWPAASLT
jgi:hypothetical protein